MEVNSSSGPIENVGDIPGIARGLRVLVVDHDTASLMFIASVLEKHSYKVSTTELASVALSMIQERKGQYDLVMADINMPEMDAFAFLSKIHELQSNVPIITMSMDATMEIARGAINKGACFFLTKPIRTRDIVNLWQHVFRKRNFNRKKNSSGDDEIIDVEKIGNNNNIPSSNSEENSSHEQPKRIISEKMVENGKQRELKRKLGNGIRSKRVEVINGSSRDDNTKPLRINWSDELHAKFLEAIHKLIAQNLEPHPKAVLNMMNVPNLTHRHVASHLQKYKMRQKLFESLCTSLPPSLLPTKKPVYHNYLQSKKAANTAVKASTPQIPIMARPLARPRRWLNVPGNLSTNKTPNNNLISNHGGVEAAANNNGNPNAKGKQTDLGFPAGINFGHAASSSLTGSPMTAAASSKYYCSSNWLTNLILQTPYQKPAAPGLVVEENCNGIVNSSANAAKDNNIVEEGMSTANQQVEAAAAIGMDCDGDDIDIDYMMQQLEAEGIDFGGFLDDHEDNLLFTPGDTDGQDF